MAALAVLGGRPVRSKPWPRWPMFTEREEELLLQVLRSGRWSYDGSFDAACGQKFAEFCGAKFGWLVANGTVALQMALEALGVGAGDEVIVPGLTFQATAAACVDVNACPVLVDIDPGTLCIDPNAVEAAVTPGTAAIIPVHLYCRMADMDAMTAIARKHGLALVEDCAHQHGSQWNGQGAGSIGDIGCFSMQESKVMTSGEGGAVVTNDKRLWERLYALRNCGRPLREGAETLQSGNYRLTEWQAAVLTAQLERLPEQTDRRDTNCRLLDQLLGDIPGVQPLRAQPQVTRQAIYAYVFQIEESEFAGYSRDVVAKAIAAELGTWVGGTYEPLDACPLYQPLTKKRHRLSPEYERAMDPRRFSLPNAHEAWRKTLGLSHVVLLGDQDDVAQIAEAVAKVQRHAHELQAATQQRC